MSNYFTNAEDLGLWVKDRPTADDAARELMSIMKDKPVQEDDIVSTCRSIFKGEDQNASNVLFGILAKHNLTRLQKEAQSQSRQRNGWIRGMRNKWNRCVDGYNEGTPWRIDRDKMYDFTHYYTDALTFDADPTRVYSGEAIWRAYIMDKYFREYQDQDGHLVGGYINSRFYVFPDAGTPANPDVPRDGGNLLGLAPGERTRKPRPHQYSTERRLEEARGTETTDLEATAASIKPIAKIAASKLPDERHEDVVYNVFKDTIDMREAGFEYENMIQKIADHYDISITSVAQIDAAAQRLVEKHSGVFYRLDKTSAHTGYAPNNTFILQHEMPIKADGKETFLDYGTTVVSLGGGKFEAINNPSVKIFEFIGIVPSTALSNLDNEAGGQIQQAADELALNEPVESPKFEGVEKNSMNDAGQENFDVTEMPET